MRIAVVYGTRPEACKLKPLIPLLDDPLVIWTGQHPDLADGLLCPHVRLNCPSQNDPSAYVEAVRALLYPALRRAELVLVQGDTASAYAGALAAQDRGIPVAHLEAGIRTWNVDDPWPEEGFRVAIDGIADLAFCATEGNAENLRRECFTGNIVVTGNTGIDALYAHQRPVRSPLQVQPRVLVTLHRRESFGVPLQQIVTGLCQSAEQFPGLDFFWPVHPNPAVHLAVPKDPPANLYLLPPLAPETFGRLLATSRAVLTDSGGVQEEAAALGVPCIVARDVTDRPESCDSFHALLAGRTTDGIRDGLKKAITFQLRSSPTHIFGDGHAAPRIAQLLSTYALSPQT